MGGRGASSGAGSGATSSRNYSRKELSLFDSIRNESHENLIIYDDNGNVVHSEVGTKGHTGYGGSYTKEGMNAVHNHPKGYGAYPSDTDLQTFYRDKFKSMTVVSSNLTVTVKQDPKYRRKSGYLDISGEMRYISDKNKLGTWEQERKRGMSASEFNQKRAENALTKLMEAGSRAGYKVVITPKGGKPQINKPFD